MITDEEIDIILLANCTFVWQKVAKVVGISMLRVHPREREDKNDLYFAKRIESLVGRGVLQYAGDLHEIRNCEIRLQETN